MSPKIFNLYNVALIYLHYLNFKKEYIYFFKAFDKVSLQ